MVTPPSPFSIVRTPTMFTLSSVMNGQTQMEDLRITPKALADQAELSRAAGRATLALNFERAAELVQGPYLRLWPHQHSTDGFFAAVWSRR